MSLTPIDPPSPTPEKPQNPGGSGGSHSIGKKVLKASAIVGALNLAARMVGVINVGIIAAYLGASDAVDALYAAQVLPNYVINVLANTLAWALMPIYIEVRVNQGREAANRLFASVQAVAYVILFVCAGLLAIIGPALLPWTAHSFGHRKLAMTCTLLYIGLPQLIGNGIVQNWSSLLNAEEDFVTPGIAPNIMSVVTVLYLPFVLNHWGVYGLAWLTNISCFMQLINLGWAIRRRKIPLMPRLRDFSHDTRRVLNQYLPMIAANSIASSSELVDNVMAASLGSGALAALSYGSKIYSVVSSVGIKALVTAVRPYFAKLAAERDWKGVAALRRTCTIWVIAATSVIVLVISATSHFLVKLMFQHGHFSAHDTANVSLVQIMFFANLPFYTLTMVEVQVIAALQRNRWLTASAALTFVTNFVFDWLLMRSMKAAGIALATALVYVCSYILLIYAIRFETKRVIPSSGPAPAGGNTAGSLQAQDGAAGEPVAYEPATEERADDEVPVP